jgi:hypothetical protein
MSWHNGRTGGCERLSQNNAGHDITARNFSLGPHLQIAFLDYYDTQDCAKSDLNSSLRFTVNLSNIAEFSHLLLLLLLHLLHSSSHILED